MGEGPIGEVEGNGPMRKWRLVNLIIEVLVKISQAGSVYEFKLIRLLRYFCGHHIYLFSLDYFPTHVCPFLRKGLFFHTLCVCLFVFLWFLSPCIQDVVFKTSIRLPETP